jgi:hypothetical protein
MNIYLTVQEAIDDLHKKGYSNNFHLFGNDLLWMQKKIFIRSGNFSIVECHRFPGQTQEGKETIVFGIIAIRQNAKGIMLNDYSGYTTRTPAVIVTKLAEMLAYAG